MIPFNVPYLTGKESFFIKDAYKKKHLSGDGFYSKECNQWLKDYLNCKAAYLTHSCTAALEIASILIDTKEGDEIIMPSYTFVSTANAFVLRKGVPVFVDIKKNDLNIDETLIEAAITTKTKAIVVVHYGGISCEMDTIMGIAEKHNLVVIEDAAQGFYSEYKGKPLGSIGHIGCFSFHETKNIISGEGGAIVLNDNKFVDRTAIVRDKGTNRKLFYEGLVDKYTWVDIGSSFLPSEFNAAVLWSQLLEVESITKKRQKIWDNYSKVIECINDKRLYSYSRKLSKNKFNAHMFYLIFNKKESRDDFIKFMKANNIYCVFHYIPLHTSPQGLLSSRFNGDLSITDFVSDRIVRLPFWVGLENEQNKVIDSIKYFFDKK